MERDSGKVKKIFGWVNENLIIKRIPNTTSILDVVALRMTMELKTNEGNICKLSEKKKCIGFVWNAQEKVVRSPHKKPEEMINQILYF